MSIEPNLNERRLLAGGDRLLAQIMAVDLPDREIQTKLGGASRLEIWETETASSEAQVTVMEFDAAGSALRASIFPDLQTARRWLIRH